MIPRAEEITELVNSIWTTSVGREIQEATVPPLWSLPIVEAQVQITGSWRGAVVLHGSRRLAEWAAAQMFALGSIAPSDEELQDAFGEIANMTGGNIKGIVSDGDAHLSLPSVVLGADYTVRVPNTVPLLSVQFFCDGEPLAVTLLHALAPPAA